MKVYCDVHSCTDSRPMHCPQCVTARKKFAADACTKCTAKPIVKEHLCDDCYEAHNAWLRELSAPKQDSDQWYTLYESEQPSLRKKLHKTVLDGLDKRLEQSINESGAK